MKKFYLGFSRLICLSILFALACCTIDSPTGSGDTTGKTDLKNEIPYYTPKKGDAVLARESLSTYAGTAEVGDTIDPHWKKLITHFIGSTGREE